MLLLPGAFIALTSPLFFLIYAVIRSHALLLSVNLPTRVNLPSWLVAMLKAVLPQSALSCILSPIDKFQLCSTTYFGQPVIHVPTIDAAGAILRSSTASTGVVKGGAYSNFRRFTGDSVFTTESQWKNKRHDLLQLATHFPTLAPTEHSSSDPAFQHT